MKPDNNKKNNIKKTITAVMPTVVIVFAFAAFIFGQRGEVIVDFTITIVANLNDNEIESFKMLASEVVGDIDGNGSVVVKIDCILPDDVLLTSKLESATESDSPCVFFLIPEDLEIDAKFDDTAEFLIDGTPKTALSIPELFGNQSTLQIRLQTWKAGEDLRDAALRLTDALLRETVAPLANHE